MAADLNPNKKSVTDYLNALVWDGTPRIDRWLIDYAGAEDTPHVRASARTLLVAAVRRARYPGCRFDQLPVLEGPQGCGKSSALRVLAVEDAWFTDDLPLLVDTRRIIEATHGKWIVEASELKSLLQSTAAAEAPGQDDEADDREDDARKDDEADEDDNKNEDDEDDDDSEDDDEDDDHDTLPPAAALTSFLSRSVDEARMTYQRDRTRVPRGFVIVGTTGSSSYLTDETGNRRFWPVTVKRFDPCLSGCHPKEG